MATRARTNNVRTEDCNLNRRMIGGERLEELGCNFAGIKVGNRIDLISIERFVKSRALLIRDSCFLCENGVEFFTADG